MGALRLFGVARTYAAVGEHDAAIELLDQLLSQPGILSAAWVRLDPVWDPLREHPGFQRLLQRHS